MYIHEGGGLAIAGESERDVVFIGLRSLEFDKAPTRAIVEIGGFPSKLFWLDVLIPDVRLVGPGFQSRMEDVVQVKAAAERLDKGQDLEIRR